ncbi:phosphoribosylglycinamide formyltransferase [Methanocalculus chunghsingensis]|uniref:phosphoribosylglycinamide formyltransferase 1 n=1 Tax=Methanocalculus chunghsingensis TaxID=156457 RepID=A0A8J8B6G5_9EURY|nr:phosphoribosylglycinamide formyltransferase [Methanocalculus chunghsingensis]MBR1368637.1 phosphoribosylglycinamide formyltransferase [Methanocalculus chunghsingensis]
MKRIVMLASGRGSNFLAVASAIAEGKIAGRCVGLIVDRTGTPAAVRAESQKIPVTTINYQDFQSRDEYEAALSAALRSMNPDLIVLAGYMRILGFSIIRENAGRIINIHPSLLPSFAGLNAHRQAIEYGVRVSGCTVHFVDEGTDTGPIILQRCCAVNEDDDESTLSDRILALEHEALPEAVSLFCEGRLKIDGRRVFISEEAE